jgi:hypothetical protein
VPDRPLTTESARISLQIGSFDPTEICPRYSVRLLVLREPPLRWATIAGDFVQNTRAALDHLVWALVLRNREEPSRQNQFPIIDRQPTTTRERQAWERALAGVGDAARERIALAQPYQREDGPEHHILCALREMSNTDKHRTLLVTATAIAEHSTPTLEFRGVSDVGELGRYGVHVDGPLRDGQEVAFIEDVDVRGADPIIEVSGHLPFMVAFGDDLTTLTGCVRRATTSDGWSKRRLARCWRACRASRARRRTRAARPWAAGA